MPRPCFPEQVECRPHLFMNKPAGVEGGTDSQEQWEEEYRQRFVGISATHFPFFCKRVPSSRRGQSLF